MQQLYVRRDRRRRFKINQVGKRTRRYTRYTTAGIYLVYQYIM